MSVPDLLSAAPAGLPEHLMQHLPGAALAAQRNIEQLQRERGGEINAVMKELSAIAKPGVPAANRVQRIRYVAGRWSDLVTTTAACRKGCSHCCHVPVMVPRSEARLIAKRTGAKLAANPPAAPLTTDLEERIMSYTGTACVFLKNGTCSIYEQRPLTCRTLANMDDTDVLCQLVPGAAVPVPYANNIMIRGLFVLATQQEPHADIREWFPFGL